MNALVALRAFWKFIAGWKMVAAAATLLFAISVSAQEVSPAPAPTPETSAVQAEKEAGQLEEIRKQELEARRQRYAQIAMLLLWGIIILGIFLLVISLVLGRRYRRIARTAPPKSKPLDPFWYLKDPGSKSGRRDDDDDADVDAGGDFDGD